MNEEMLQNTIKELATKIANLEIENAQLKALLTQSSKNDENKETPVMPNLEEGEEN